MVTILPRIVLAAPGSGHGKTTLATGLMAAFRRTGLKVAGFKVGPDYIDPGYHFLATARPGRNLDPYLCHPDQLTPLLLHGAASPEPADVAIVEGAMGLFDGQLGGEGYASTAHVAASVGAPVILVLDISQVSRTAAAIVSGLNTFDPSLRLSGVILNKAGSARHAEEITAAMAARSIHVLGVLPRDDGIEAPSRHLGLVPAAERPDAAKAVSRLAAQITNHVSLTKIMQIARSAPALEALPWDPIAHVRPPSDARPVVAIAGGRAFTFRYPETDELLRAAGCEPVILDPMTDLHLPEGTAGLYLGGGFPEVHATELAGNDQLRAEIGGAVAAGMPTVAECAGLLYLCRTVDGSSMVGALPADATMTGRLTLGYRSAIANHDHLLALAGVRVTGHEFHRTAVEPVSSTHAAWLLDGKPVGFSADPAGRGHPTLHASYLHLHWAGHPAVAQRFANAVHDYVTRDGSARPNSPTRLSDRRHHRPTLPPPSDGCLGTGDEEPDLRYHGDREVEEGLIDLAVNVRLSAPPDCLIEIISETAPQLADYPDPANAIEAIAAAHDLRQDQVLPTAGGAEAFTLVARAVQASDPVIIHPQFTEPEAALIAAGNPPSRVILTAEEDFQLDPARIPAHADLIMIGNPTNPTSVLHSADTIRSLLRRDRLIVADEAFMDAVPGEVETMIGGKMTGLVVIRSLTKTWGLAGLRAGYAVGDAAVIAAMRGQQPHWSVSTPALAVMTTCLSPEARDIAATVAAQIADHRATLLELLADLGLQAAGAPAGPFVLIDTAGLRGLHPPGWVRQALREHGLAVRRGETFPGLGPDWIRVAVRDPSVSRRLADALRLIDCRSATM